MTRYIAECIERERASAYRWHSAETFSRDFAHAMAEGHREGTGHLVRVIEVDGWSAPRC